MVKIVKNPAPVDTAEEIAEWEASKPTRTQIVNNALSATISNMGLTEVAVSVKVTIPLQQYGNIEMFVSQKFTVHDTVEAREDATIIGLNQLKRHIAEVVLPLAEAEVISGRPALLREANPDVWLQRNSSLYRWLRVAQPDMEVPAMNDVIMDENRIEYIANKK
jgi:hypothetical protein